LTTRTFFRLDPHNKKSPINFSRKVKTQKSSEESESEIIFESSPQRLLLHSFPQREIVSLEVCSVVKCGFAKNEKTTRRSSKDVTNKLRIQRVWSNSVYAKQPVGDDWLSREEKTAAKEAEASISDRANDQLGASSSHARIWLTPSLFLASILPSSRPEESSDSSARGTPITRAASSRFLLSRGSPRDSFGYRERRVD